MVGKLTIPLVGLGILSLALVAAPRRCSAGDLRRPEWLADAAHSPDGQATSPPALAILSGISPAPVLADEFSFESADAFRRAELASFDSPAAPSPLQLVWFEVADDPVESEGPGSQPLANSTATEPLPIGADMPLSGQMSLGLRNFYSPETAVRWLPAVALGYTLANGDLDERIRQEWQGQIRDPAVNRYAKAAKVFGEGSYTVPAVALGYLACEVLLQDDYQPTFRTWNETLLRAYFVGTPVLLLSQQLTGGSRPGENADGSNWNFMADDNGVSGHAFMGAMPFLVAAHLAEDWRLKGVLWAASIMTPLSRVNDDMHYMSQAIMGWSLAFATARAVALTGHDDSGWAMMPLATSDGAGMAFLIVY